MEPRATPFPEDPLRGVRHRMVRRQLAARGIRDLRVLAAMGSVRRECFVGPALISQAYDDTPLPVESGQTISQPYMVALMTREARVTHRSRVLEVGTGTGYHTAVLAKLARHVWTVERIPALSTLARMRLERVAVGNVTFMVGDGAEGHAAAAPFDAIVVTAASPSVPDALLEQLAPGGHFVAPIGDRTEQDLVVYERTANGFDIRNAGPCRFVPLISPYGFTE